MSMTETEMLQIIENLKRENGQLKSESGKSGALTIKFGHKPGVVCVYGLGVHPVSLYEESWRKLLAANTDIIAFLDKARAEGLMPSDEAVAAGKAAAKANNAKIAAAKKLAEG